MLRLTLFVITVLGIYAAMHLAVWFTVRPLLGDRPQLPLAAAWAAAMILAPLGVRLLENAGLETAARGLALVGYSWMGFLFLAFAGSGILFGYRLLVRGLGVAFPPGLAALPTGPGPALALVLLVLATGLWGFREARQPVIEHLTLGSRHLSPKNGRLRIVQVSDLHLGLLNRQPFLTRLTTLIAPLQPDLLVATGDIVDAQINHLDGLAQIFAELKPPLGKYAVIGNHEVYAGLEQATDFIVRAGFRLLRNETVTAAPGIFITGVDDPAAATGAEEADLLPGGSARGWTLLLKHRPRVSEDALGHFDLQLSGHSHRGQIFPFNFITGLAYPRQDGRYRLADGSTLYTSRGSGTWGPPMRVLAPPEITVIDVLPEPAPAPRDEPPEEPILRPDEAG